MAFVNRCIFLPTAGGTSTWTVSSAKTGYLTPAQAGAVNATAYRYTAELRDGTGTITAWEVGSTTYTSAGTTLTRTVLLSSNANALVNFASPPDIMLCVLAEDLYAPQTDDGAALGSITNQFSDLSLASGGVISWAANDVYILHATNGLYFAGASSTGYNFDGGAGTIVLHVHSTASSITNYYDNPLILFQNDTSTNGNMAAMDYRTVNGNSAGAVVFRFIDHTAGAAKGQYEIYTANAGPAGSRRAYVTPEGNKVLASGTGALATTDTDGFTYIATCAGTPTGVPSLYTGTVPMIFDTTNSQFWFYTGGAWKQPKTPAGAATVTWQ